MATCCGCSLVDDYGTSTISGSGESDDPFTISQTTPDFDRPVVRVVRNTIQTIPDDTPTPIVFESVVFDQTVMWSGVDPTRLTVATAGLYLMGMHGLMSASSNAGFREYSFRSNGIQDLSVIHKIPPTADAFSYSNLARLNEGDYVEAVIRQTSGGNLNLNPGGFLLLGISALFWMCYIGKNV